MCDSQSWFPTPQDLESSGWDKLGLRGFPDWSKWPGVVHSSSKGHQALGYSARPTVKCKVGSQFSNQNKRPMYPAVPFIQLMGNLRESYLDQYKHSNLSNAPIKQGEHPTSSRLICPHRGVQFHTGAVGFKNLLQLSSEPQCPRVTQEVRRSQSRVGDDMEGLGSVIRVHNVKFLQSQ